MDLGAGKRRTSAEERAKKFVDGWCLYCSWFNQRAAEYAGRKKPQTFKASGEEVKEVGTKEGSEESGKDQVNPNRMALWLTEKVLEFRDYRLARWRYWNDQWKANI
jgi:hypothetical protein